MPRRPPNSFTMWLNANRESIHEKYSHIPINEIYKKQTELWQELDAESRKVTVLFITKL